jgi:pimeloyl-ACP methyl ester carboxylesterase
MILHLTDCEGCQLACRVQGQGAPCVLLHGFPFDSLMWELQTAELAETARLIVPDLRGFGNSGLGPDDAQGGVSMQRYARDVACQLDDLGVDEPVVLAGFSMGGYVAWQFALQFPERVRALALCATRAAADSPAARTARLAMAESVFRDGSAAVADALLERLLAPDTRARRPEVVALVRELIGRAAPDAIAAAQRGMADRPDVRLRLGELDVPALVLVGQHDVISPVAEMREIAAALPQGEWREIPAAGHLAPLENPRDVSDALRQFLETVLGG